MTMCPCCTENIEHLVAGFSKLADFRFVLNADNTPGYSVMSDQPGFVLDGFTCPACGNELYKTEEEAIAFLRGVK